MSDSIPREAWSQPNVKSIAYFCGPWIDADPIPPFSDHDFPQRDLARYQLVVDDFKKNWLPKLWPNYRSGDERASYTCVNLDPTERYVLSVKDSVQYRLHANESGFDNVVLCGDWTYNGINAGCVEAAITGGLWASNALCGVPAASDIVGENPDRSGQVLVRREGRKVILEPVDAWPDQFLSSLGACTPLAKGSTPHPPGGPPAVRRIRRSRPADFPCDP